MVIIIKLIKFHSYKISLQVNEINKVAELKHLKKYIKCLIKGITKNSKIITILGKVQL